MSTNKVSIKGTVTIPVEMRRRLEIEAGDEILFMYNKSGEVILRKAQTLEELRKRNKQSTPKRYRPIVDAGDYFLNNTKK